MNSACSINETGRLVNLQGHKEDDICKVLQATRALVLRIRFISLRNGSDPRRKREQCVQYPGCRDRLHLPNSDEYNQ